MREHTHRVRFLLILVELKDFDLIKAAFLHPDDRLLTRCSSKYFLIITTRPFPSELLQQIIGR